MKLKPEDIGGNDLIAVTKTQFNKVRKAREEGQAARIKMIKTVKCSPHYVIVFDESLIKSTQEKQLDVHVRYWAGGEVQTRYLGS